mgnify:CR=1 FL=1
MWAFIVDDMHTTTTTPHDPTPRHRHPEDRRAEEYQPQALTPDELRHIRRVQRAIRRRSFAVLSSVSSAGFAHAAGVVYDSIDTTIFVHTMRTSRKARNIAANSRVGLVIPVRRLPVGPPFTVQFQAHAELLAMDHPEITTLLERKSLKTISGHGALDEPDGCFNRIVPNGLVHTYGIGVSTIDLVRDPLHTGARSVRF